MRQSVLEFASFMENQGISLRCPIEGCNMQGSYADHITSTNGSHYANLYKRGVPFTDGVPVEELRQTAWQQINIRGGAVRFNHLDWEVQMWRGDPPPCATFGESLPETRPDFHSGNLQIIEQRPSLPIHPCTREARLEDLQEDNCWYMLKEPASVPTSDSGDWQSIPHVVGGKRNWANQMRGHASKMAEILQAHGIFPDCSLCPTGRGWEEHIPGPVHFQKINELLGDRRAADVRSEIWQEWLVQRVGFCGRVRFNHLDGEIQMLRANAGVNAASGSMQHPPPPVSPPASSVPQVIRPRQSESHGSSSTPAKAVAPPSISPQASYVSQVVAPPPMPPPVSSVPQVSHPQQCESQASSSAPAQERPSASVCPLAMFMWKRTLPQTASTLSYYIETADVDARYLTCQACFRRPMSEGVEEHLRSDAHLENIARTMAALNPQQLATAGGKGGARVQHFEGRHGNVWFNHLTGESGSDADLGNKCKWDKYDYPNGASYWYNHETQESFQVYGNCGVDRGLWQ